MTDQIKPFLLDADVPIPRPVEKEDWAENASAAEDEFNEMIEHFGGIDKLSALAQCQFHAKWYMSAGHKALGRMYVRYGKA